MRVVRPLLALLLAAVAAPFAAAQEPLTARVDKVFAAFDRPDSPGCALGVYRDGKIEYSRGYGMADIEARVPIGPRTVFDVGSSGKQFTASAILMLAADGKLSLDDDVRKYVPELPAYQRPITISHLLHHTSGLRDYIGLLTLGGADIQGYTSQKDALDAIVRQKALNFDPGAEHLYSNSGYFLMSQIVERVSGKSLRAFAQERIFTPLGMTSTRYVDNHKELPERAASYTRVGAAFRIEKSDWEQTGDGAVNTSVEDLLRWDQNFYDAKVGGRTLITELQKTGSLANGAPLTYARGLVVEKFRGLDMVSHGGSWAGYRADLIRFPGQHLSVAVLCNVGSAQASALARSVAAIYLEDKMTPPVTAPAPPASPAAATPGVTVSAADLQRWAGMYRNPVTGTIRNVTIDNGVMTMNFGQSRQPVTASGAAEFTTIVNGATLRMVFEGAAGARRIRQFSDGREAAVFSELLPADPASVPSYAGRYFSDELNVTYTVVVVDGRVELHRPKANPMVLRPIGKDLYGPSGDFTVRFGPAANGHTQWFELSLGRIRGLRFERKD